MAPRRSSKPRKPARRSTPARAPARRAAAKPRTARARPAKAEPLQLPSEGAYAHVELYSDSPEATKRFYREAFGWTFTDVAMGPGMRYTMYQAPGPPHGGLMGRREGPFQPPATFAYIRVGDADAAARRIEAAGGKVLVPRYEVPHTGWFVVFEAPGGIVQAVWQDHPDMLARLRAEGRI